MAHGKLRWHWTGALVKLNFTAGSSNAHMNKNAVYAQKCFCLCDLFAPVGEQGACDAHAFAAELHKALFLAVPRIIMARRAVRLPEMLTA